MIMIICLTLIISINSLFAIYAICKIAEIYSGVLER
jgi:hypothetical protein